VIFLYDTVTIINIFMNVLANDLLLCEKRGKSGFFRKKRLKRGILKEQKKRRKKRWSGMPAQSC